MKMGQNCFENRSIATQKSKPDSRVLGPTSRRLLEEKFARQKQAYVHTSFHLTLGGYP